MSNNQNDFLVEIGCEELPPKALKTLAMSFSSQVQASLTAAELQFKTIKWYASPRRLALLITALDCQQAERLVVRTGPTKQAAFNTEGQPSQAALGFARSCGVELDTIPFKEDRLYFEQQQPGDTTVKLLPQFVNQALSKLPIPKPMRWGNHEVSFVRPVHWVVMLYGQHVIADPILGVTPTANTFGHRFHHPEAITIQKPADYADILRKMNVIANFDERSDSIRQQIESVSKTHGTAIIDAALLDEVNSIVEWPVALVGEFDQRFLNVPHEALISAMQVHQKSFPVKNAAGELVNRFITISNIESKDPATVIAGNERVIRARLTDAEFFYQTDIKTLLHEHAERLKTVIFQAKLGTLFEKSQRTQQLATLIAKQIKADSAQTKLAAQLAKADLMSAMVGEFPELQGIMGYYYASHEKLPADVALAIREHYLPRFAGDDLPTTDVGCAVALADKIDTLIGIFGINQAPTGDKDPFGLRRAALGILRIIIDKQLPLDLRSLLEQAYAQYEITLPSVNTIEETLSFIMDRLRAWYNSQGVSADIFAAVHANYPTKPLEFEHRIKAVQHFKNLPEAKALAAANKRVSNILKKLDVTIDTMKVNPALFESDTEKNLYNLVQQKGFEAEEFDQRSDYEGALTSLASLQMPVDQFFEEVFVMAEDLDVRNNRLLLLANLRNLFLQVADISLLAE
ncbi:MAG: glycine--tRNA ligase subunit beta [Pseudomonadota bacterium]|nr:glycine--tRNA ligase subunit beta [Pseudomonadota bacterium]